MYDGQHIVKNISGGDLEIFQVTVLDSGPDSIPIIGDGDEIDLALYNFMPRIFSSYELFALINSDKIIFKYGGIDLSKADSITYFKTMGLSQRI